MKIRLIFFILLIIAFTFQTFTQTEKQLRRAARGKVASPEEIVSFNADVPYSKTIQSLSELCRKLEDRLIIDRSPLREKDKPIGINIQSMYWKDALELILRSNQLWYNDYPEYIEIISIEEIGKQLEEKEKATVEQKATTEVTQQPVALVDSSEFYSKMREVNISAIFFDVNKTKLAESGIGFKLFRGKGLNLNVEFTGDEKVLQKAFSASIAPRSTTGTSLAVDVNLALDMFESDQLGEVIARPQMIVREGSSSMFQIGQDFSVFERDFSGNIIQRFYPTGTILTVKPKIYKIGDNEFIDLQYKIEKSTFEVSTATSVINKTLANGSLMLLDGEEGYIGGLYSNEETVVRQGVPILKDLPWWVFGLRYLFGYDSKKIVRRELLVLMKAEILPTIEERAEMQRKLKTIQDARKEIEKDVERSVGKKIK